MDFQPPLYYLLVGREVIPTNNIYEWGRWFENMENRRIASTNVAEYWVSTVFLGLDHGFSALGYGPPILFETMVFAREAGDDGHHEAYEDYTRRYASYDEAAKGHEAITGVLALRTGVEPEHIKETLPKEGE